MMKSLLPYADMVKVSEEELEILTGIKDYSKGCSRILMHGAKLALVTLGPGGAFYKTPAMEGIVKTRPVTVVDTTGAGDSFAAGMLYRMTRLPEDADIFSKSKADMESDIRFANAAASLCVTKRGAIPAMPLLEDVLDFQKHGE
jgi:fructokinase